MSPNLKAAIAAADSLAWQPVANLSNRQRYYARLETHQQLKDALAGVRLSANASLELRFLHQAMLRVAAASFSNRFGMPYYERREAIKQLRGCLVIYRESVAA